MLQLPDVPGDKNIQGILKKFVNDRLIALMEGIILDEVDWNLAMDGELSEVPKDTAFEDLVNINKLMEDMDFAANVSMSYLPDNYPVEKANREFLGLYKLLKAKKEYVPELPMEYVLYQVIMNEVWQIDMINEDSEDGLFDDLYDDPFFEGIEDEVYDTVERIAEPDRSVVLAGLERIAEEVTVESEVETTAEDILLRYEDLREYDKTCFWDTDFALLDNMSEDALIHSEMGRYMGLSERKDTKVVDFEIGKSKVRLETNVAPWENEED